jgi:hypothetical protein
MVVVRCMVGGVVGGEMGRTSEDAMVLAVFGGESVSCVQYRSDMIGRCLRYAGWFWSAGLRKMRRKLWQAAARVCRCRK